MRAIILVVGRGKLLKPFTKNIPKSLIKVRGKTLIEHNIEALKKAGVTNIVINIAYLGEYIQKHLGTSTKFGVHIDYSIEQVALETGGSVIKALPLLGSAPFIVTNSDILYDYDLSALTLPNDSLAHLLLVDNPKYNPKNGDFSLIGNQITHPNNKTYTFSGIGLYHPNFFQSYLSNDKKLPLSTLFKKAINNKQLTGEYYSGNWQDIGTPERLKLI